ncbi:hypothetical protein D3C80_1451010 [compost metagenome]
MLAFVFVQAFDLHVENRVRIERQPHHVVHIVCQHDFVIALNLLITLTERRIIGVFLQPFQGVEIVGPLHLQRFINQP